VNYDECDDEHGESYDSLGDSSRSATKGDKRSSQRKKKEGEVNVCIVKTNQDCVAVKRKTD
jgi:hypothetical protein